MILIGSIHIQEEYFPDGTPKLLDIPIDEIIDEASFGGDSPFTITWRFEDIAEQILLYNLVSHLRDTVLNPEIELFLPYVPNARMDRVKNDNEVFTLKYFARFINDLKFQRVVVLDPHSDVSAALIDRVCVLTPEDYIARVITETKPDIICFPDAGSLKRYSDMFTNMTYGGVNLIPRVYCDKIRDWKTGKLLGMCVNHNIDISLEGKNVLIVDDLCSRGGTFAMCANELKKLGVNEVNLWITHCENTIFSGVLLSENSPITKIYTTDSLAHADHDKIYTYRAEIEL